MESRLWDMLSIILQEMIEAERNLHDDSDEIRECLVAEGYDADEIDSAFSWLHRYFISLPSPHPAETAGVARPGQGLRVLSFDERMVMTPEAFDYLHGLETRGLITPPLREEIIYRAMQVYEDHIGPEEMKMVVLVTLAEEGHHKVDELLRWMDSESLHSLH